MHGGRVHLHRIRLHAPRRLRYRRMTPRVHTPHDIPPTISHRGTVVAIPGDIHAKHMRGIGRRHVRQRGIQLGTAYDLVVRRVVRTAKPCVCELGGAFRSLYLKTNRVVQQADSLHVLVRRMTVVGHRLVARSGAGHEPAHHRVILGQRVPGEDKIRPFLADGRYKRLQ